MTDINLTGIPGTLGQGNGTAGGPGGDADAQKRQAVSVGAVASAPAALAAMPQRGPARRSTPPLELQVWLRQPAEPAALSGTAVAETVEQRRPQRPQRMAPVSRAP